MKIKFKSKEGEYRLEATNYGVDIFLNDGYLKTLEDSDKKPKKEWIQLGIEQIIENRKGT